MGASLFSIAMGSGVAQAAAFPLSDTVACPTADQVVPALNENLISNPGAEDFSAYPDGGPSWAGLPDCWTVDSTVNTNPYSILSSASYSGYAQVGGAGSDTVPPGGGQRFFFGGDDSGGGAMQTFGFQTVDLSSIGAVGQPFALTVDLGGYATQADSAMVVVSFEDGAGNVLLSAQTPSVTPAERGGVTQLLPTGTTGVVPAGTTQAVVEIETTTTSGNDDASADNLNLTIGPSAPTVIPPLPSGSGGPGGSLSFTTACPTADQVVPALNENLISNPGAEDFSAYPDGGPSWAGLPDCWTVDSTVDTHPYSVLSSASYSGYAEVGGAKSDTVPPGGGQRFFFGGDDGGGGAMQTFGFQTVDLSSIGAAGQPFALTADTGGYSTQADWATVIVSFEDGAGNVLYSAQAQPVTAAERGKVTQLLPNGTTGVVPAGTTQAVVEIETNTTSSNDDASADNLNLTIGSSADAALTAAGGFSSTPACPSTDLVTPALNQNLIRNGGAEDTTPFALPSTVTYGAALPDCWTSSSPVNPLSSTANNALGATFDSILYSLFELGHTSVVPYQPTGPGGGLDNPTGVAAADGTVYVSNTKRNVVAAVKGSTTTVVAGSLQDYGEAGDGGPATASTLYQPAGLAVDQAGDLFIADSGNNVVREVTPDGVIHRFAGTGRAGNAGDGTPATTAQLDDPQAVAVDAKGDVFITNTNSNIVDEVTPDGIIHRFAGTGKAGFTGDGGRARSAELDQPSGVAVDSDGNVFIADSSNNVVRRVGTDGIITTAAGDHAAYQANDGVGGNSGDGGPATSAELHDPEGVAVDPGGDLFIADTANSVVREVTPAGIISTAITGLNTPANISIDSSGLLYVADTSNHRIVAETAFTEPPQPGTHLFYGGASLDPFGNATAGVATTGSQTIDLSSLSPAGQPYELRGFLGGFGGSNARATATFEDASGATLGMATLGPVTQAGNTMVFQSATGTVPAGTVKAVVTLTMTKVGAGVNNDALADNLGLFVGDDPPAPPSATGTLTSSTGPGPVGIDLARRPTRDSAALALLPAAALLGAGGLFLIHRRRHKATRTA